MNFEQALARWDVLKLPQEQLLQMMEECAELSVECSHVVRGRGDKAKLAEETADVFVMLQWLFMHEGGEFAADVKRIACEKMNRNLAREGIEERIDGYETYGEKSDF